MLRVVQQNTHTRELPFFIQTTRPVTFAAGFHAEEGVGLDAFTWMSESGVIEFEAEAVARFLEFEVFCEFYDLSQHLTTSNADEAQELELVRGWNRASVAVAPGSTSVAVEASKLYPLEYYPGDPRALAVRFRMPRLHQDAERHRHVTHQHANTVLNRREMLDGKHFLTSTAPALGIDMYGVCNVKPACVYCEWDFSKAQEGDYVDAPFDASLLEEWGDFFDNSKDLINCSIGEPFMMKNFDELMDIFGDRGKFLEITTNGQILTDKNIEKLLGRNIDLYISLDAGTPETYAKVRNDRFDDILVNLRRLIRAKGGSGQLPRINLVFMPMKVNVHELEDFVKICADLDVDRMILRPLNYSEITNLDWERGGYHFSYRKELLPFDVLARTSALAAHLARKYGVEISDQMDFGSAEAEAFAHEFAAEEYQEAPEGAKAAASEVPTPATPISGNPIAMTAMEVADAEPESELPPLGEDKVPMCTEPWKSLYILRRGVLPCCYGSARAGQMDEYRDAWNSQLFQDLRRELSAGRFHYYCLDSQACPLVRKAEAAGELPKAQIAFMRFWTKWYWLDRRLWGLPGKYLFTPAKYVAIRILRVVSEEGYTKRVLGRYWRRLRGAEG
ncbi:MAG: radical SAM/SPASM domain-containing protein [Thermoanaerobaculia bacterium]